MNEWNIASVKVVLCFRKVLWKSHIWDSEDNLKLEIGQGARSRGPKTGQWPMSQGGIQESAVQHVGKRIGSTLLANIFLQHYKVQRIGSLWNIFLNLKLFLLVSTAGTYKQQYSLQLCHPGTKSVQPIQSYSAICLLHSLHHPSISFRFMSCIVFVQQLLPTHPREIQGGSLNKCPVIPRAGRYPGVPTSTPPGLLPGFDARALFPPAVPSPSLLQT